MNHLFKVKICQFDLNLDIDLFTELASVSQIVVKLNDPRAKYFTAKKERKKKQWVKHSREL